VRHHRHHSGWEQPAGRPGSSQDGWVKLLKQEEKKEVRLVQFASDPVSYIHLHRSVTFILNVLAKYLCVVTEHKELRDKLW
jgi:hypothetical protein